MKHEICNTLYNASKVVFWIDSVASLFCGGSAFIYALTLQKKPDTYLYIIFALLIVIVGVIGAWVISSLIEGFSLLIETALQIEHNTSSNTIKQQNTEE